MKNLKIITILIITTICYSCKNKNSVIKDSSFKTEKAKVTADTLNKFNKAKIIQNENVFEIFQSFSNKNAKSEIIGSPECRLPLIRTV